MKLGHRSGGIHEERPLPQSSERPGAADHRETNGIALVVLARSDLPRWYLHQRFQLHKAECQRVSTSILSERTCTGTTRTREFEEVSYMTTLITSHVVFVNGTVLRQLFIDNICVYFGRCATSLNVRTQLVRPQAQACSNESLFGAS